MAFSSSGTLIEIFGKSFGRKVRAPFEVPVLDCFEESGDFWAAQSLMGKSDAICFCLHGMREESNLRG